MMEPNTRSNEKLVTLIRAGRDPEQNLMLLYQQNAGIIWRAVHRYAPDGEQEDYLQQSFLALLAAVRRYDPEQEAVFITYLWQWLKAVLLRYRNQTRLVRIPERTAWELAAFRKLQERYHLETGRPAGNELLSALTGKDPEEIERLRVIDVAASGTVSLDSPLGDGGEAATMAELIPGAADVEAEALDALEMEATRAALLQWLSETDPTGIVKRKWLDGMTLRGIAAADGLTLEEARLQYAAAMTRLRNPGNRRRLLRHLPERWKAMARG